ncbi:MAG: DASS family sodium-coupled anion symporter [Phycisphaeraceae bacterium]
MIPLIVAPVLALIVYFMLPEAMGELPRRAVAIFIVAAIWWATEAIPLYATSLCLIGLEVLLLARHGGFAPEGDLRFDQFFDPFASPVIILFMGGFLLASAVTKHGLDRAIASRVLSRFTRGPLLLIYGIMGITAFFSMWMSNTATTAMMIAIVAPLIKGITDEEGGHRFATAIVLAVPLGANIGGIGTPIGSPPNAVALAALRSAGIELTFLQWMMVAVPLLVLLLAVAGLLLYWLMPPGKGLVLPELRDREAMPRRGKATLGILVLTIGLWLSGGWTGIPDAVVAIIAAALLTALGMLHRSDVDSIDWNILILMWGGLSLGNAMQLTGLVNVITELPLADLQGFLLSAAVVALAVGLSTFMSNTAAANLIIPIAMAIGATQALELALLTALACSFAMALPISTPPNAIAFATGRLPAATLLRVGGLISIICIGVLLAGYQIVLPLVLGR